MDVVQGCWRCETKETNKRCTRCNFAEYCGTRCLDRDKIRHKVECDMWNRNTKCAGCQKEINCLLCSACREISYCSRECQRQNWPSHKAECKLIRKLVKMTAERRKQKFQNVSHESFPCYFGNTIATDVLKLNVNEADPSSEDVASQLTRDYNILFAGAGDLRNLLLTTASLPSNFTGNIMFTLNDIDPFVLARNVLFLYMMITLSSRKSIETSITNIWYSLLLPDEDFCLLTSTLSELIEHTVETLKVKTSFYLDLKEVDLELMKEVWKMWREMECDTCKRNSIDLSAQRSSLFGRNPGLAKATSVYIQKIPQKYRTSATKYFENGLFLPKDVCKKYNLQYDNPTLTGRTKPTAEELSSPHLGQLDIQKRPKFCNFVYCIEETLTPFNGWDYIQAENLSETDSIVDLFHTYIASIIKSVMTCFQKGMIYSKLIIENCINLCNEPNVEAQFDRIMTSNTSDYTGIKKLLSSMRPLLSKNNKHAVLVTETLNWIHWCPSADLKRVNPLELLVLYDAMQADIGLCIDSIYLLNDYFDNTTLFIRFLRILFLETSNLMIQQNLPHFPKVFENYEGLRLRDFTKELNKVIPFRYRGNVRLCNNMLASQRNIEWQLVGNVQLQ
ncbi:uncharacterized protein LOC117112221 [Anneissia japonica]|uniref:uncharacterized protein LOC117112221 n=1 Tax=Anneissia japonica TaxID=1529436 RepID=UPI001425B563|nr:uncharacterized protein LOC117112221 [Anneissia japonica]